MSLPALFGDLPQSGRLHGPQPSPYAQIESELLRRESVGTDGFWHDTRRITITIRGLKAEVLEALRNVLAVFNRDTVLTYPSGARFVRWWPVGGPKLTQETTTKDGQDVWAGSVEAEVWSIRRQ